MLQVRNADLVLGQPYIVTAVATHGTIAEQITPNVGVRVEKAVRWGRQSCQGVARLHDLGLLHRDLKPENIFLDDRGDALIGDLGLSQLQNSGGYAEAGGSPPTMAPEVAAGFTNNTRECYTARSDVFSLGASLYWMLAGSPALPSMSVQAIAFTHVPDIWNPAPHLPKALRDLVNRAVHFDASQRPSSPANLDASLASLKRMKRAWNRIPPHSGHQDCFEGEKSGSTSVSVCVSDIAGGASSVIDVHHRTSGRKLKEHCRQVPSSEIGPKLRSIFRNV